MDIILPSYRKHAETQAFFAADLPKDRKTPFPGCLLRNMEND